MLLEDRPDQFIIQDEYGNIDTKPKTDYFMLKYKDFNGDRIEYKFNDESYILETFDDGIFNCTFKNERMQIRQADKIAFCINWHKYQKESSQEDRLKPFMELFKKNFADTIQKDVLKQFLKGYEDRLNFVSDGIEIDKRFLVNKNGQAQVKVKGVYHYICIVAKGYLRSFNYDSKYGNVEINARTLEIIAKVFFLLNPNINDKVFTDQLKENCPEILEQIKRDLNDFNMNKQNLTEYD